MTLRALVLSAGLLLGASALQAHQRITIRFQYAGETLYATAFSNVRGGHWDDFEDQLFHQAAQYLDRLRLENYLDGDPSLTSVKRARFVAGFSRRESLAAHDEILVIHKTALGSLYVDGVPLHDPEILGLLAVDRMGDPFLDYLPGWDDGTLLFEKRLKPLGLTIPRPVPKLWEGLELPKGVFPHWEPHIAETYFQPGRVYLGDVVHPNALFAKNGLWPLVHAFGNFLGIFSTGRLIPKGVRKVVSGVPITGPAVLVPTQFDWETFNEIVEGKRKEGSRTRYYRRSRTFPVAIDGVSEWSDPWLGPGSLVQILEKTGDEFRIDWPILFEKEEKFSFVRDVELIDAQFWRRKNARETEYRVEKPGEGLLKHLPSRFAPCLRDLVAADGGPGQTPR